MYEFELRHYDAAIGRFVTTDPYEQFASPYLAMGNNPIVSFDPDGGYCTDANGNAIACPDDAIYDEYRDSDNKGISIPDKPVIINSFDKGTGDIAAFHRAVEGMKIAPAMNERPDGFHRDWDEMMLNVFGYYSYRQGGISSPIHHVDANGVVVAAAPEHNDAGAIGLIGGPANAAVKSIGLPALKKLTINMKHILSGHTLGGARASSLKSLFPSNMTSKQIEKLVKSAYKTAKRVKTQGDRIKLIGTASNGTKIEMWLNKATKTLETAYPLK